MTMTGLLLTPRPDCRLTRVRKACTTGSSWTCDISKLCHSGTAREKAAFAPRRKNLEVLHSHYISEGGETLIVVLYLTLTSVPTSRFQYRLLAMQKKSKSVGTKSLALYHWPKKHTTDRDLIQTDTPVPRVNNLCLPLTNLAQGPTSLQSHPALLEWTFSTCGTSAFSLTFITSDSHFTKQINQCPWKDQGYYIDKVLG